MTKPHIERVKTCMDRLQKEGIFDSQKSDIATKFMQYFNKNSTPEDITKNLLYMHSKGFNFKDAAVQDLLFADNAIDALSHRELFFKEGLNRPTVRWKIDKLPLLKKFWNDNINKDLSSSVYFGLDVLKSNSCIITPQQVLHATTLLTDIETNSIYHVRNENESIDCLAERVAVSFVELKKEGYTHDFVLQKNGGLTTEMIRVLGNPLNNNELNSLIQLHMQLRTLETMTMSLSSRTNNPGNRQATVLNELISESNFISCWKKAHQKICFLNCVAEDNNEKLTKYLRYSDFLITIDILRAAFLKLPEEPSSELNQKLVRLQQGVLEQTEQAVVDLSDIQIPTLQVNWSKALCGIPLAHFTSKTIAEQTRLCAISILEPITARKALGLEGMDELQQATLIQALKDNECLISGDLQYLTRLIKNASAKHGDVLFDYFLESSLRIRTGDLQSILGLTQWISINGSAIKETHKNKIQSYIDNHVELCISSRVGNNYRMLKTSDPIRMAWQKAKTSSLGTEAEKVYRETQKLREINPINLKAVSQLFSDYMTINPLTAFTVELKKSFGDFFSYYTPPRTVASQVISTSVANCQ